MFAGPAAAATVGPPRWWGWPGLASFAVFLAVAVVTGLGHGGTVVAVGLLLAVAAAVPCFLTRTRLLLLYTAAAGAGVALLAQGDARDVGWFALCVLQIWCVAVGGLIPGLLFWAASATLFTVEAIAVDPDPGWIAWGSGVTFSVFAAMLLRRQLDLLQRLHEAQADLAERSRADERTRIARELHDGIAHSLTVSLLHVSSARLAVEHDPQDAARALAEAERLGRQSLAEVRTVMGLRSGDRVPPPLPGISDLRNLVDQVRGAGVEATLTLDGDLATLPATTGVTVYRIVQEALTNATKHAPGAPVTVRAQALRDSVRVDIDSAGAAGHGSGMGLGNMRERAAAVGGTCTAGPGGSGWLVSATLPLEPGGPP
ncbi:MAG TPA: histidine kinase [Actinocrinis sp.]